MGRPSLRFSAQGSKERSFCDQSRFIFLRDPRLDPLPFGRVRFLWGDVGCTVPRHLREVGIPPSTPLLSNERARGSLPREAHWWTDSSHPVHRTREVACLSFLLFRICFATFWTSLRPFLPVRSIRSPFLPFRSMGIDLGLNPSILPTPDGIEPIDPISPLPVG